MVKTAISVQVKVSSRLHFVTYILLTLYLAYLPAVDVFVKIRILRVQLQEHVCPMIKVTVVHYNSYLFLR